MRPTIFRLAVMSGAIGCFIFIALVFSPRINSQEPGDKSQPTSYWMQKKLEYSKNILAGISAGDLDKTVANAESMRLLSSIEGFIRGRTPGYRTQLQIFEESADEIVRQGKDDNVEGAALAFTQLTVSCVNCHKQLRMHK